MCRQGDDGNSRVGIPPAVVEIEMSSRIPPLTVNGVQQWSEVLCCITCSKLFDSDSHSPINLVCGHVACTACLTLKVSDDRRRCPVDDTPVDVNVIHYPINECLLKILSYPNSDTDETDPDKLTALVKYFEIGTSELILYRACVERLMQLCDYLHRAESETGRVGIFVQPLRLIGMILCVCIMYWNRCRWYRMEPRSK